MLTVRRNTGFNRCERFIALPGILIDTNTANVTGSTATANIYYGTKAVGTTIQSTIVQLAQEF